MGEKIWPLLAELALLAACGGAYYLWQRQRILYGPRGWRRKRLHELREAAAAVDAPADFQAELKGMDELTNEFLSRWSERELPVELKPILEECHEWAQSQPRT